MSVFEQVKFLALRIAWRHLPWNAGADTVVTYAARAERLLRSKGCGGSEALQ